MPVAALAQAQALREAGEWEAHAEVVRELDSAPLAEIEAEVYGPMLAEADAHERGLLLRLLREAGR